MEQYFWSFRELNLGSMMLRILLAMLIGGTIGFERERKGRAAGFRTYMLVAVGAGFIECVAVSFILIVLSIRVFPAIETAILNSSRNMLIYLETESIEQFSSIIGFLKREQITIYDVEIRKEEQVHLNSVTALLTIRLPFQLYHAELMAALSTLDGVITVDEV